MKKTEDINQKTEQHGVGTMAWAKLCHNCNICKFAYKNPDSNFNKVMAWHRTWCPGWQSHTKVYGLKSLS